MFPPPPPLFPVGPLPAALSGQMRRGPEGLGETCEWDLSLGDAWGARGASPGWGSLQPEEGVKVGSPQPSGSPV